MPPTSVSQRLRPLPEEKTIAPVRTHDVLNGRYRLLDKVGEGGMGAVFVAHDQQLDRQVAVKLLAAALVNDPEVNERFEREARLTARLDHPNIVPIYDVGRHEGRPFIVMKLLTGDSLAGLLRAKGGLTADETLKLMKQLAAGLDYIHAQGFIHRDIKAGNIFVSPEGHATILDFGILRQKSATTGITRTGMVMGTPHYMAPEQALGQRDVDHRVDLYALAVVLFECMTGTLPFEADSELRLIQLQAHAPPPEVVDRAPWIPQPVAQVMKRALAKKPEDRFNSAAALVAALEEASQQAHRAPTRAQPAAPPQVAPTTAPSLRKLSEQPPPGAPVAPRRRAWWLGLALFMASGAVGAWWWWPRALVAVDAVDAGAVALPALEEPDAALAEERLDAGPLDAPVDAGAPEPLEDAGLPLVEPVEVPVDAGVKRPTQVAAPKKKGQLNVLSTQGGEPWWAQVTIDGTPRGRTPLLLDLVPGRYLVRVERTGFKPVQRELKVLPGKAVLLKVELVPER